MKKIHLPQPDLNPRTLDLEASTLPRDHRVRPIQAFSQSSFHIYLFYCCVCFFYFPADLLFDLNCTRLLQVIIIREDIILILEKVKYFKYLENMVIT